jgi:hypothetical protein
MVHPVHRPVAPGAHLQHPPAQVRRCNNPLSAGHNCARAFPRKTSRIRLLALGLCRVWRLRWPLPDLNAASAYRPCPVDRRRIWPRGRHAGPARRRARTTRTRHPRAAHRGPKTKIHGTGLRRPTGSSRMAKTHPRWKREAARRLLDHPGRGPGRGARAGHRGVESLQSEGRVRRYAAKAAGRAYGRRRCPAMAPASWIAHHPAYQKVLERHPGGGVGSGQRCS